MASSSARRARASKVPVYRGAFGPAQAERLLWRAGFGPRRGEAEALAARGFSGAVRSLTRPGPERLSGPAPVDDDGNPIAPGDAWGHDHLWWLDRMVRSNRPLVERMTLVWHDWFATSRAAVPERLMLRQNALLRRHALGSFEALLLNITRDPAMLLFLSGSENSKWSPNENYARELMELFTLGAGRGYTERDVREQARALTGWRNSWSDGLGAHNFRLDRTYHDAGVKRVFGRRGRFGWRDACRLCLNHRAHPSFFVTKLWGAFIPTPPSAATRRALEAVYRRNRRQVRPVVEAILMHPALYDGPRMVKPPIVYLAGLLRAIDRGIDTEAWSWLAGQAGQTLFEPPNVAGWDETRWLDTSTFRARWWIANYVAKEEALESSAAYDVAETSQTAVAKALDFWGGPPISEGTRAQLLAFADRCAAGADQTWKQKTYRVLRQNALRVLIATSPDLQTS